jgi:predicted Zn finger-like uncharacterized protein
MRIRCPSCSATYEVADALLENPRTVRCARCAHEWTAEPLSEDQSQPNPAAEVPRVEAGQEGTNPAREPVSESFGSDHALGETPLSAIERLAAPSDLYASTRRRDRLLTAAWALSIAALAALGVAGYTERDTLMRQWPASKRVYATLGLLPVETKAPDPKGPGATPTR